LKGDISRAFAMDGGTFTVQAGMKARFRKKSYNFNMNYYGDADLDLADVLGAQTYRLSDLGPLPGKGQATDYFYNNIGEFELDPITSAYESAAQDYSAKEDILATYLLGRWDSEKVRIIGGVRMEQTRNVLRGNVTEYELDDEGETTGVISTPNVFTKHYTDWLPSLTARFEPSQGLVFRAAAYKSLVRPKLSQLAPRFILDEDYAAEFGNPNLKPYRAWNFDASAEWYFSNNGALSAGLFYKSIKDYSAQVRDFDDGVYNGVAYSEASYYVNGDTAKVKGVELSFSQVLNFLPAPLDGFLVNLNYTFTDADGKITSYDGDDNAYTRKIGLPNASRHTFNAVLGYEKGPISLRAAGTYRSKYLDEIGDGPDTDRIVDNHFQLDLSAKYKILPGVRLFADWVNVNNAKYFAYQNFEGSKRLLQYEEYNWTAKFGISASF
jgi:TonB-dependent receptor